MDSYCGENHLIDRMNCLESYINIGDGDVDETLINKMCYGNTTAAKIRDLYSDEADDNNDEMEKFIVYLKTKFEGPLLDRLHSLNEENIQLNHELRQFKDYIKIDSSINDGDNKENPLVVALDRLKENKIEIDSLKRKIQEKTKFIEDCIENEENYIKVIDRQKLGIY
jgi:hypothetical protein